MRYGRIEGKVVNISADAINDKQTGEQYYLVDVSIESELYEDSGQEVTILPGMVASIDVLSGKRTILDYFWQPIAKTKVKLLETNVIFGIKIAPSILSNGGKWIPASQSTNKNTPPMTPKHEVTSIENHYKRAISARF